MREGRLSLHFLHHNVNTVDAIGQTHTPQRPSVQAEGRPCRVDLAEPVVIGCRGYLD